MNLEPVFSLHQPWASLLFTPRPAEPRWRCGCGPHVSHVTDCGRPAPPSLPARMVKEWETRPNACPASKLGVRVWIHAAAKTPGSEPVGRWIAYPSDDMGWALVDDLGVIQPRPLPLGAILGSVVFSKSPPIMDCDDNEHICRLGDRLLHHGHLARPIDGQTEWDISDQLPFGDWTAGRWAWRVTEASPLPEPVPFKGGPGWSKSIDPAELGVAA